MKKERYFTAHLVLQPLKFSKKKNRTKLTTLHFIIHKILCYLIPRFIHTKLQRFFVADSTMAFGVAAQHHFHHLFSIQANSHCSNSYSNNLWPIPRVLPHTCSTKWANGYSSVRFRPLAKASANKNSSTIPEKSKPPVDDADPDPDRDHDRNSFSASVMNRLR